MLYRELTIEDFTAVHRVRMAVKENKLSDPTKVTFDDYAIMLKERGRGWLCESEGEVVGFAIADAAEGSIWALFVLPEFDGRGIGRALHDRMVSWCFGEASLSRLWLSTDPGTRAEAFYKKAGWQPIAVEENGEIRFELRKETWQPRSPLRKLS